MFVAIDYMLPWDMMSPKVLKVICSMFLFTCLTHFCSSWPGLLQFGVRLGESCCHVWGHQHHCQTGPLGPTPAPKMHHHALRLCRNVSSPHASTKRDGMFDLHETCWGGRCLGSASEQLAYELETTYIEQSILNL